MGDFEVTLTFGVKAADRFEAARQVYRLIDAQTPTSFWVCNEGGVGDEVRVDDTGRSGGESAVRESVHELVDDLYRLGVAFGAGQAGDGSDHKMRVEEIKRRLIAIAAQAADRPAS